MTLEGFPSKKKKKGSSCHGTKAFFIEHGEWNSAALCMETVYAGDDFCVLRNDGGQKTERGASFVVRFGIRLFVHSLFIYSRSCCCIHHVKCSSHGVHLYFSSIFYSSLVASSFLFSY